MIAGIILDPLTLWMSFGELAVCHFGRCNHYLTKCPNIPYIAQICILAHSSFHFQQSSPTVIKRNNARVHDSSILLALLFLWVFITHLTQVLILLLWFSIMIPKCMSWMWWNNCKNILNSQTHCERWEHQ